MKIRTDFVTNSSSSSYIIAFKKGFTAKDIKEELLKTKETLKYYLDEYKGYWEDYDYDDDLTEIISLNTEDEQIDMIAEKIADRIVNTYTLEYCMKIGDYLAFAYEGSSEDIELFSNWLYSFASINTNNLKISGFN